jgi:poly(hydroxyalkanoate) depolymerase family esterase
MYIYVPDKPATKPPILVVSHFCGGSASAVFDQARTGGIVKAADMYGFIMVVPQTTNNASSAKCWDVGSTKSLTHDGGGDTQAVAQMVKYTINKYGANPDRVYATGDSSGGMMTQALLAVYPDVFKAGSSFAGVAAGCWSAGWSAASNWGGTCAGGNYSQTAQQWGDKVRAMYPGYSGHRPRVQLFHGDADVTINYKNLAEGIKEWTNVLGLPTAPTSTEMNLTLGSHKATRQRWQNSCPYVTLEAIVSIGGDHGPSDALFNSTYVIPFLGLDKTGDVDPEIAACGAGGGGRGGASGAGGAAAGGGGAGAMTGSGGAHGNGGASGSAGGASASGGSGSGGTSASGGTSGSGGTTASGGATASGGSTSSGGSASSGGSTGSGGQSSSGGVTASSGGSNGSGGSNNSGSGGASSSSGGAAGGSQTDGGGGGCSLVGATGIDQRGLASVAVLLALAPLVRRRRRSR